MPNWYSLLLRCLRGKNQPLTARDTNLQVFSSDAQNFSLPTAGNHNRSVIPRWWWTRAKEWGWVKRHSEVRWVTKRHPLPKSNFPHSAKDNGFLMPQLSGKKASQCWHWQKLIKLGLMTNHGAMNPLIAFTFAVLDCSTVVLFTAMMVDDQPGQSNKPLDWWLMGLSLQSPMSHVFWGWLCSQHRDLNKCVMCGGNQAMIREPHFGSLWLFLRMTGVQGMLMSTLQNRDPLEPKKTSPFVVGKLWYINHKCWTFHASFT